jgi:hypothetical protein
VHVWTRLGSFGPLFDMVVEPDDVPVQEHDCPGVCSKQSQVVDATEVLPDPTEMQAGDAITKNAQQKPKAFIRRKFRSLQGGRSVVKARDHLHGAGPRLSQTPPHPNGLPRQTDGLAPGGTACPREQKHEEHAPAARNTG